MSNTAFVAKNGIIANGVFTANSTLTQSNNLNVSLQTNTTTLNVTTSANIAGVVANSSGITASNGYFTNITGTIQTASQPNITANSANYIGTLPAANVVSNAALQANLANYQTSAGLSANVLTLTSNNSNYLNGANLTTIQTQITGNSATAYANAIANAASTYAPLTGANFSGSVNATSYTVGTSFVANTSGAYVQSLNSLNTVNAASFTVGSNFTANATAISTTGTVLMGSPFSFRNRIINGTFFSQRNALNPITITAGSGSFNADRWAILPVGGNITAQVVNDTNMATFKQQITGGSGVTGITILQRIYSYNIADLAGKTVTLSVNLSNSLLTTVNWAAYYPSVQDNYTSTPQIATGSFTVSSTQSRYSTQISLPSNVQNGLQIQFYVGAQTSGTWTIGQVQLEAGSIATPFEILPREVVTSQCQAYYASGSTVVVGVAESGTALTAPVYFKSTMISNPNITYQVNSVIYIDSNSVTYSPADRDHVVFVGSGNNGTLTNSSYSFNWYADAELK